jgi:hypothetical protein
VLVYAGQSSVAQQVRGLQLGVDDWITTPVHPEELIARVEAVVRRRRRTEPPARLTGAEPFRSGVWLRLPDGERPRELRATQTTVTGGWGRSATSSTGSSTSSGRPSSPAPACPSMCPLAPVVQSSSPSWNSSGAGVRRRGRTTAECRGAWRLSRNPRALENLQWRTVLPWGSGTPRKQDSGHGTAPNRGSPSAEPAAAAVMRRPSPATWRRHWPNEQRDRAEAGLPDSLRATRQPGPDGVHAS